MAQDTDNSDHSNLSTTINTGIQKELTNSLIFPIMPNTPQQNYGQAYSATSDWQTSNPGIFNFHTPLQNSVMGNSNNFLNNQQDVAAYDDGDDFYGSDSKEENTQNKIQTVVQGPAISGLQKPQNKLQDTAKIIMNSSGQTPAMVKSQDKRWPQAVGNYTPSGSQIKKDPAEYAAELRAKLLAKRGTSTTPTPSTNSSKANNTKVQESPKQTIKSPASTQMLAIEVKAPQHLKSNGVAGSQPSDNSPINDRTNASAPMRSTDIEGLISEYRASEATSSINSNMTSRAKSNGNTEKNKTEKQVKDQASKKPLNSSRRGNDHGRSPGSSESGEIVENPLEKKEQFSMSDPRPKPKVDTSLPPKPAGSNPTPTKSRPSPLDVQRRPSASAGIELRSPSIPQKVDSIRDRSSPPRDMRRATLDRRPSRDDFHRRAQEPQKSPSVQANDLSHPKHAYKKEFEMRREQVERNHKEKEAQAAERKKTLTEPHNQTVEQQVSILRTKATSESAAGNGLSKSKEPPTPTFRAQKEDPVRPLNITLEISPQKPDLSASTSLTEESLRPAVPSASREDDEDLGDWLEISGFYDLDYRKKALARHRKVKALEAQKAALEHEAQIEFFEKVSSLRSKSTAPRENIESKPTLHATASLAVQPTSVKSMAPPPLSNKDDKDDIGIKIKNTANRDGSSTASRANVPYHDTQSAISPLKRRHLDTDQHDLGFDRLSNKKARVNSWDERPHEKVLQISPAASSGDDIAFEPQRSKDGRTSTYEYRTKSRSPVNRRRSASPYRRGFIPGYAPRQNSWTEHGSSSDRYQNFSRSDVERTRDSGSSICQHCDRAGHQATDCPYRRRDDRTKHPVSAGEDPSFRQYNDRGGFHRESSYSGNHQHHNNVFRGGARGVRGGSYNIRGSYKASSYTPVPPPAQARGRGSLNLQAGGQFSSSSSLDRP